MRGAGGGIELEELTTGALYPEVREILERPDRIRREAFKLMQQPEASIGKALESRNYVFTSYRESGEQVVVRIPQADVGLAPSMQILRDFVFLKLVELLEKK